MAIASSQSVSAQSKYTLSGTIRDKKTGETLIGASVFVIEEARLGTASNDYGFYSITLARGNYRLVCRKIGYRPDTVSVDLSANKKLDFNLPDAYSILREVIVTATTANENVRQAQMGVERIDVKEIAKLPVIFGEKDILKTLQLLPGVKSAGEGSSGFFVRGGCADQNLILLDEAPVYNASHLLGFFSTFNSDALKDVSLLKGLSPAQYGGRLSSVLDVKMKEGNNQNTTVTGGIGLISSRLSVEGPIRKDKGSFIISGRRTYADLFLKLSDEFKDNSLYFYDLNLKANYKINEKNRLYLSGYFGRDVLGVGSTFGIDWGNVTGTLRWSSIISPKLFSNTSLIFSDYSYDIALSNSSSQFNVNSKIRDINFKEELTWYVNSKNTLKMGINSIHHTLTPNRFGGDGVPASTKNSRYGWENAAFIQNTSQVSSRLNLEYGLRLSAYSILGGDLYKTYQQGVLTDQVDLAAGSIGKTYVNLEPRLQVSYLLTENSSIKGGYARNAQNLHLLSNSTSSTPTDQWVGSSYTVKPEISDQIGVGYFRNFNQNEYQFSVETYYKDMQNQVDYKNGADIQTTSDVESQLLFGKGRAYGVEFLLKKTKGRLTGWIGYTLSKTERQIEGINNGNWFDARQDRTHDWSIVATYELNSRWTVSGLFVYNTGNAVTFPSGKYQIDGNTTFLYTERNGYRMPSYHRFDLSFTYTRQHKKKYESSWNFGLYNAYGRENAYIINFENKENDPTRTVAKQTALFRWVPSVTYNFKF